MLPQIVDGRFAGHESIEITFACDDYYHTRALRDERVGVERAELPFLRSFPAEMCPCMLGPLKHAPEK